MTITRRKQPASIARLSHLVDHLESRVASLIKREFATPLGRRVLANLSRQPVGPRRPTDAQIAARLQARGIDPKFMPEVC